MLSIFNALVIIVCSIIYLYLFRLKQKTILERIIMITTAITLSGSLAIEVKSMLVTHLSYGTSLLGTFFFWVTVSILFTRTEISQSEKYGKVLKKILFVFSVLLLGLGCWMVYLDLSQ